MTHDELVAAIIEQATDRGLTSWPTPPTSPRMAPGWVDVVILGRTALFVEAKAEDGRRTMPQLRMAEALMRAGLAYRLWRPSHLHNGTVARDLGALT